MSKLMKSWLPDGEVLYKKYWLELGASRNVPRLIEWCKVNGYFNPNTGKRPTPMAVWFRMWRWAVRWENQPNAYEIWKQAPDKGTEKHFSFIFDDDKDYSEDQLKFMWRGYIQKQAKTCLGSNAFNKFMRTLE